MATDLPAGQRTRMDGLFIRTGTGVVGPYPMETLTEMARNGALPAGGAISVDGASWIRADRIPGLREVIQSRALPDADPTARPRPGGIFRSADALKALVQKICGPAWIRHAASVPVLLSTGLVLLGLFFYGAAHLSGLTLALTGKRLVVFLALGGPGALAAAAALVACGNAALRSFFGLSETERRFLALHLPRSVVNRLHWGRFLRNWLYRGEWLLAPSTESPRAYVHLFREGEPLQDVADEVALWERLARTLPYSLRELCLPGETLRQVQQVASLPSWSNRLSDVTDGYALGVVLDHHYIEWAQGFLARARKRLSIRNKKALEFVLSQIELGPEARILAVCVYPRVREAVSGLEATIVDPHIKEIAAA